MSAEHGGGAQSGLDAALRDLAAQRPLLVALDFDGTLAPLVDDPSASRMISEARPAVDALAALAPDVRLALVSGRRLEDLAALADPPPGTWLVGSHGAETGDVGTAGLSTTPRALSDDDSARHAALVAGFEDAAAPVEGAWVETKPTAAVLHTRRAESTGAAEAITGADAVAARLGLAAMHGKDVVEAAVVETSKGEALALLRSRVAEETGTRPQDVRVLYAGDDTTDERAFEYPGAVDVAVKVGDGPTSAAHRVADPSAVADLLVELRALCDPAHRHGR